MSDGGSSSPSAAEGGEGAPDPASSPGYRGPEERPVLKLSVYLIDTYKHINKIYYEARARIKQQEEASGGADRGGVHNNGWDDAHYDYIVQAEEVIHGRYMLKHRIGKGSFGQVVCAWDQETQTDVAIKIIKSRRPFQQQALTEISLLMRMNERDVHDDYNVVRLLHHFNFRSHQCLVFEMLSCNLYELLKNTKFVGVSLNLIRKFSKQILKALEFLARPDVDIVHCDLKPENILLRHPRRSAIKLIDFGSSCLTTERKYTYIQSRFYRSPEILLGLPYEQKIDVWSLGCVLVEMHTGEPLFGGSDQVDQMCRIVDMLGMPPLSMLEESPLAARSLFFEKVDTTLGQLPSADSDPQHILHVDPEGLVYYILKRPHKDAPRAQTLADVIGVYTSGPFGRRREQEGHTLDKYLEFLDFIQKLLIFDPVERHSAAMALQHTYLHVHETMMGGAAAPVDGGTDPWAAAAAAAVSEQDSAAAVDSAAASTAAVYISDPSTTESYSADGGGIGGIGGSSKASPQRVRSRSAMANEARQRSRTSPPPQVQSLQELGGEGSGSTEQDTYEPQVQSLQGGTDGEGVFPGSTK